MPGRAGGDGAHLAWEEQTPRGCAGILGYVRDGCQHWPAEGDKCHLISGITLLVAPERNYASCGATLLCSRLPRKQSYAALVSAELGSRWRSIRLWLCGGACHFCKTSLPSTCGSAPRSAGPPDGHPHLGSPPPHAGVHPGLSASVSSTAFDIIHIFHFKYL